MFVWLTVLHMIYKGKLIFVMHFDTASEQQNDGQLASVTFTQRRKYNWNLDFNVERDDWLS